MSSSLSDESEIRLKYIRNADGHFVCPTCNVVKQNQSTMHYHMRKHTNKTPFECRFCNKGFLQRTAMDLHIRSRHSDMLTEGTSKSSSHTARSFICPFEGCKVKSLTRGNLRTHCMRSHFQEESDYICIEDDDSNEFQCIECEKSFKSKTAFYYHCHGCISLDDDDERRILLRQIA
jgi:hypothetical protein